MVVRCSETDMVALGFGVVGVWSMPCVSGFSMRLDSLTVFQIC
jgi:hypothetical protein